jgi:hypothetical protein
MAATTLSAVPASIRAGDTLLLQVEFSDYPADESWVLTYTFRRPNGSDITFAGTSNGEAHLVNVDNWTTQAWEAGSYDGIGRVTDGTTQHTVWTGKLQILPDLASQDANFDARSHARIMLEAIEAVLENRATKAILSTTIAGQSITRYSPEQLLNLRAIYRDEVRREEYLAGQGDSGSAVVRFVSA